MNRQRGYNRRGSLEQSHVEARRHIFTTILPEPIPDNQAVCARSIEHESSPDKPDATVQSSQAFVSTDCQCLKEGQLLFGIQEACNRLWRGQPVCLHNSRLQQELAQASIKSPIEQEGHAILNVQKLVDELQLRHDINFDRHIIFRSNTNEQQLIDRHRYYSALAFEIILISKAATQAHCLCSGQPCIEDITPYIRRLPEFFEAIRKVTKALIRTEHGLLVDQAIDVPLLMSQLRNDSCDLLSLAVWLGGILKQSCSPLRDASVDDTTYLLTTAFKSRDAGGLAHGLSSLYNVFNTMKLDVVNHQIRILVPQMVDESVEFVQRKYDQAFKENLIDYRHLWRWFHENRELQEARAACEWNSRYGEGSDYHDEDVTYPDEEYLTRYTDIVFQEVVKNNTPPNKLPKPFELDQRRIYEIRDHITKVEKQQCQVMAFNMILNQCGPEIQPSVKTEQDLLGRLRDIGSHSLQRSEPLEATAIEIVRTAYDLSGRSTRALDPFQICQARDMLNVQKPAGHRVATLVRERLHDLIESQLFEEINGSHGICDLLPFQILDRYKPVNQPVQTDAIHDLTHEIRTIAQNLAHITLIQWRIWAQLLWFKSKEVIFESEQEYLAWQSEVRARIEARYSPGQYARSESQQSSVNRHIESRPPTLVEETSSPISYSTSPKTGSDPEQADQPDSRCEENQSLSWPRNKRRSARLRRSPRSPRSRDSSRSRGSAIHNTWG